MQKSIKIKNAISVTRYSLPNHKISGEFDLLGSGLGIPTDRDQRSWVFLNNPKKYFSTDRKPKKYFQKTKPEKMLS